MHSIDLGHLPERFSHADLRGCAQISLHRFRPPPAQIHRAQRAQHVSLGFLFICSVVHFWVVEWWWWCQGKKSVMLKKGREWNCKFSRQEFVFTEGWICGLLMRAGGGQLSFYSWPSKQAKKVWKACLEGTYTRTHALLCWALLSIATMGFCTSYLLGQGQWIGISPEREGDFTTEWTSKQGAVSAATTRQSDWTPQAVTKKFVFQGCSAQYCAQQECCDAAPSSGRACWMHWALF
jgi:hypothetical protein